MLWGFFVVEDVLYFFLSFFNLIASVRSDTSKMYWNREFRWVSSAFSGKYRAFSAILPSFYYKSPSGLFLFFFFFLNWHFWVWAKVNFEGSIEFRMLPSPSRLVSTSQLMGDGLGIWMQRISKLLASSRWLNRVVQRRPIQTNWMNGFFVFRMIELMLKVLRHTSKFEPSVTWLFDSNQ